MFQSKKYRELFDFLAGCFFFRYAVLRLLVYENGGLQVARQGIINQRKKLKSVWINANVFENSKEKVFTEKKRQFSYKRSTPNYQLYLTASSAR